MRIKVAPEPTDNFWEQMAAPLEMFQGKTETTPVEKPMNDFVNAWLFWPGLMNLFLLGCFIAGIATLVSSLDRFRWRTLGIGVAIYMVAAMIKILGMSSETFSWTSWLTFFSLYEPELSIKLFQNDPAAMWQLMMFEEDGAWRGFGQLGHNLILAISTGVFFLLAMRIFYRRDIPAPL